MNCIEKGEFLHLLIACLSSACYHCTNPICLTVCPADAITQREEDGIVVVDSKKCWGESACGGLCKMVWPYDAPQFGAEKNAKMQKCMYACARAVYVKFRNQTRPPPDSKPSPLPPLYEFRFSVADGETWESLLTFEILDMSVEGDSMLVGNISFNGVASSVDSLSMWDSEHDGFYYQLFFELWLYDIASQSFRYHNQFVGICLNITSASYI